jgi:hypothetical protein
MTNEHTLLSRVFKCKYFDYQPSYAWRSLFNAKPVIDLGLRWSIGNGQQVKIWNVLRFGAQCATSTRMLLLQN